MAGEDVLKEHYEFVFSSQLLSTNWPRSLILEVYTGDVGIGKGGIVLVKNEQGEIIHSELAEYPRAGWNNIYYGMDEKGAFLMSFNKDSRDNTGGCSYRIYRLNNKGDMVQTEGSSFEFGASIIYDDALFKTWMAPLEAYMKNSKLLLSTQDGVRRTMQESEYDKNNYEMLKDRTDWWAIGD